MLFGVWMLGHTDAQHKQNPTYTVHALYFWEENHQIHIRPYTVYKWYFWEGNHQMYGHIRCRYTFWPTLKTEQQVRHLCADHMHILTLTFFAVISFTFKPHNEWLFNVASPDLGVWGG
jgi:hypothetical protein